MRTQDNWQSYQTAKSSNEFVTEVYRAVHTCVCSALDGLVPEQVQSALDIACGYGDSTKLLIPYARNITGIDPSKSLIEVARASKDLKGVDFIQGCLDDCGTDLGTFDLITGVWYLDQIHTLGNLVKAFQQIDLHLADSGCFCFVVPSATFYSPTTQEIARHANWEIAHSRTTHESSRGIVSFGEGFAPITAWNILLLMRLLSDRFHVHTHDVRGTLVECDALGDLVLEPHFEVICGRKRNRPKCAGELEGKCISFSAGTTSTDPYGFRVLATGAQSKVTKLAKLFPELSGYADRSSILINAYGASLGLDGAMNYVDTYLNKNTFCRALTLAAKEKRLAIVTAQPLIGAEFLLNCCDKQVPFPTRILWAVGGYYLPKSLERTMRLACEERGCSLDIIHCYGVAEIGHTCFAATERGSDGLPLYIQADDNVIARIDEAGELVIESRCPRVTIATSDHGARIGDRWKITSGRERLSEDVQDLLESWTSGEWRLRSGRLQFIDSGWVFQLREGQAANASQTSVRYFEFCEMFGVELTSKPNWGQTSK